MVEIMKWMEVLVREPSAYLNNGVLPEGFAEVEAFHTSMAGYERTPLVRLHELAGSLGVREIFVKDESKRFGLNAFKGLGVSYAIHRIMTAQPRSSYLFVSCTDGNHGKALAWQVRELGQRAVIFMPKGSEARRVRAIEAFGAEVVVTEMNYDDTVRYAAEYALAHDGILVQDTALPGYTKIPNDIVLGYSTMVREALAQMEASGLTPTHVFVQAGVGSMAGGVVWYLMHHFGEAMPFIGVMEAENVACLYESAASGHRVNIGGEPYTAMAGLNCGEANPVTFPLLKAASNCFIKCSDELTFKGMARAGHPVGGDAVFSSGESGAVGLGLVEEVLSNPLYLDEKSMLGLNEDSVILLFSTEGEIVDVE